MAYLEKSKLFNSPKLDSHIKSANVQKSERRLGFFTGPMLIYMAYFCAHKRFICILKS